MLGETILPSGMETNGQIRAILDYGAQIGMWLSSAWVLHRLLNTFFWDGIIARSIGHAVPHLLKSNTAAILLSIAVTGIVGIVFGLPITGFFATSGAVGLVLGFVLRNMIQDIFTGVALNVDRSFSIGDWITVHRASMNSQDKSQK